jgi:hypothetical protein
MTTKISGPESFDFSFPFGSLEVCNVAKISKLQTGASVTGARRLSHNLHQTINFQEDAPISHTTNRSIFKNELKPL